jgi:hypothetical protein
MSVTRVLSYFRASSPAPEAEPAAGPSQPTHPAGHVDLEPRSAAREHEVVIDIPPRRPGTPLLSSEDRINRSDRFESSHLSAVSQAGSLPASDHQALPEPTPRERLAARLDAIEFRAPAGSQQRTQQAALETEYLDWAVRTLAAREQAFGDGRYAVDRDRSIAVGEAALPAAYDGVRQFLSSSSRSPLSGALATWVGPQLAPPDASGRRINVGELNNNWDPAVIGGSAGGATALAMDSTLLSAMDRRARLANFPKFSPVDLKALVPDPSPVQLRVVEGRKEYFRPADTSGDPATAGLPTMASLQEKALHHRNALAQVQGALQGQGFGLLAQPMVTGAANALRRQLMPAAALTQGLPVLGGGILASGGAGAATRLGLGLAKAVAFADVDNLVGGTQRVNLFATKLPQPGLPAASWSDAGNLPRHALDVTREAGSLAAQYLAGPWRDSGGLLPSARSLGARVSDIAHTVLSNTLASVFSTATGPLVAQVLRNGSSGAQPGESLHSPAYLLHQFAQSATNDFVWNASRSALRTGAFDLAASLDRWRDGRQAQLLQTARQAQDSLPALARQIGQRLDERTDAAPLQRALQSLEALAQGAPLQPATLRGARTALQQHLQQGDLSPAEAGPLMQHLDTALQRSDQRDAMVRWRAPAVAEGGS